MSNGTTNFRMMRAIAPNPQSHVAVITQQLIGVWKVFLNDNFAEFCCCQVASEFILFFTGTVFFVIDGEKLVLGFAATCAATAIPLNYSLAPFLQSSRVCQREFMSAVFAVRLSDSSRLTATNTKMILQPLEFEASQTGFSFLAGIVRHYLW